MLKFTNASGEYRGNPLYINSEWIVSIFEQPTDGGSLATIIYGGPNAITWHVEESLNEAVKNINGV
jgi:hypothetical protein